MIREYHFISGPVNGLATMCRFDGIPPLKEVGHLVIDKINQHLYALKDTRTASWSVNGGELTIWVTYTGKHRKTAAHYELDDNSRTFIWTTADPE